MTTSADERVRIREQIARLRGLLEAMEVSLGMGARPPLSETAAAIADAGIRLVATAGRHDAYQRAEAELAEARATLDRIRLDALELKRLHDTWGVDPAWFPATLDELSKEKP